MKLKQIQNQKRSDLTDMFSENLNEIPTFSDDENTCLAYATNKVRMKYLKRFT